MTNDIKHLFKCLLSICILSLENCLPRYFTHFLADFYLVIVKEFFVCLAFVTGSHTSQGSNADPAASTFQVLRLQVYATANSSCNVGDGVQSYVHARQALYQLSYNLSL